MGKTIKKTPKNRILYANVTYSDGSKKVLGPFDDKAEAEWILHMEGDHIKSWYPTWDDE